MQSNVVDKALRDYDATVNENTLMTNSIGLRLSGGGASFKVPSRGVDVLALDEVLRALDEDVRP